MALLWGEANLRTLFKVHNIKKKIILHAKD